MNARKGLIIFVFLCVGLAIAPVLLDLEEFATPQQAPMLSDGHFTETNLGKTHYVHAGAGPALIMVPGLTGNHTIWDQSLEQFGEHFSTYAIDTFGRGYSDRKPDFQYDRKLYRQQLQEFMAAQGITKTVLLGTSMGGAIAIDFAANYPDAISALILVDTAGLPFETPALKKLIYIPYIGEYLISLVMPVILHQGFERGFYDPDRATPTFRERYSMSARIQGFRRAVLESLRTMPLHGLKPEIRKIRQLNIPVLLVWGKEDRIVPYHVLSDMQKLLPEARAITIVDAGHMPHAERPNLFASNVLNYLQRTLVEQEHKALGE